MNLKIHESKKILTDSVARCKYTHAFTISITHVIDGEILFLSNDNELPMLCNLIECFANDTFRKIKRECRKVDIPFREIDFISFTETFKRDGRTKIFPHAHGEFFIPPELCDDVIVSILQHQQKFLNKFARSKKIVIDYKFVPINKLQGWSKYISKQFYDPEFGSIMFYRSSESGQTLLEDDVSISLITGNGGTNAPGPIHNHVYNPNKNSVINSNVQ